MGLYDLVFKGGGAKGSSFCGAMDAFTAAGHKPRRIIGTSAGAITATLIGAGYTAQEMLAACNETLPNGDPVFSTFMDAPQKSDFTDSDKQNSQTMQLLQQMKIPLVGDYVRKDILNALLDIDLYRELFGFNECGGFYAGNAFLSWFRTKLQAKRIDPDITWKDFAAKTGADVSVVTSDVTEQEMVVLNERTAPACPVAFSVRMSMSIPFVWREVVWQDTWGTYLGRAKTGHIFVDGGVLSNFALSLVTESTPDIVAIMGNTDPNGAGTLGLFLDETLPVPGSATAPPTPRPRLKTADRVTRLVDAMRETSDATVMREYAEYVCHLPTQGYGTTEFRMSKEKMELLIAAGRDAMNRYLNRMTAVATRSV